MTEESRKIWEKYQFIELEKQCNITYLKKLVGWRKITQILLTKLVN